MQNAAIFKLRSKQETALWCSGFLLQNAVDNKYPRAFQGLRTDWISFFMFPFVILSQKQGIKRYNLQFGSKKKHCTSLQSLNTIFLAPQKSRKADLTTCTAVFKSRILLPNSPSSMLSASTNSASQTQQVTNHGIFSKYFEKTKQDKNEN